MDMVPMGMTIKETSETKRKLLIIDGELGGKQVRLVLSRRARSQLDELGGLEALTKRDDVVLRVFKIDENTYYVVRATTTKYVAIPHRVLFDFVRGVIRDVAGVDVRPRVVHYSRRTVAYYPLYEVPLNYARPNDAVRISLAVSNANTGEHSIRVYGYVEVLACSNGLVLADISKAVRMAHKGRLEDVLSKVAESVKEVLSMLRDKYPVIARRIEELQDVKITDTVIRNWLEALKRRLGIRYTAWLGITLRQNEEVFGSSALAMFQAMTFLIPRIRNEDKASALNKEVNKLLDDPAKYIEALAKPSTG